MAKPAVSEQVQVNFRMPVEVRDSMRALAEENNRSLNAEIVAALESWLDRPSLAEQERQTTERIIKQLGAERAAAEQHLAAVTAQMERLISRLENLEK